jgi:hypothetical protein
MLTPLETRARHGIQPQRDLRGMFLTGLTKFQRFQNFCQF